MLQEAPASLLVMQARSALSKRLASISAAGTLRGGGSRTTFPSGPVIVTRTPRSRDAYHPLEADLVVVDEVSMLDVLLANRLAKAVPPGAHLLLVGDPDQLPSVSAGDVLADLLDAGQFPVTRLERIFRQRSEEHTSELQ